MTTDRTRDQAAIANAKGWLEEIVQMVEALEACTIGTEEWEAAHDAITQAPLSVMVRDGWRDPVSGTLSEDGPEEFEILLSTGGPALRLYGQLGPYGQVNEPVLEYQDWATPWTEYVPARKHWPALETFCNQFWFGE